jgi:hypothetical protein
MRHDGEDVGSVLATQPAVLQKVSAWYERALRRRLEIREVPPGSYRLVLRGIVGSAFDVDLIDTGEGMIQVLAVLTALALSRIEMWHGRSSGSAVHGDRPRRLWLLRLRSSCLERAEQAKLRPSPRPRARNLDRAPNASVHIAHRAICNATYLGFDVSLHQFDDLIDMCLPGLLAFRTAPPFFPNELQTQVFNLHLVAFFLERLPDGRARAGSRRQHHAVAPLPLT